MTQDNLENVKELQTVRKDTTLSLLALIAAFYMIFSPFIGENMDSAHHNSISKAQSLAYQVAALENKKIAFNQDALKSSRIPASISSEIGRTGVISENEKGQPYHYEIVNAAGLIKITIWSKQDLTDKTEVLIPSEKL